MVGMVWYGVVEVCILWYGMAEVCEGASVEMRGWVLTSITDIHSLAPGAANRLHRALSLIKQRDTATLGTEQCAASGVHRALQTNDISLLQLGKDRTKPRVHPRGTPAP